MGIKITDIIFSLALNLRHLLVNFGFLDSCFGFELLERFRMFESEAIRIVKFLLGFGQLVFTSIISFKKLPKFGLELVLFLGKGVEATLAVEKLLKLSGNFF
ncbi:hypothetical protein AYI68_g592 [Smittium mucronatum]|uniref:Uncharacterized protein n=1 Tax=Smittium mucronatum TaxID=133383 RepID=A0A1R0H7N7_9FUNG|nr:hypothetical protein AYI68_g592 [Smittium mucronatum]